MRQKEALDGAIEEDTLYVFVGFECGDDFIQFRNRLRAKDIQRRVVKCDAPVRGSPSYEADLSGVCPVVHICLRVQDLRVRHSRSLRRETAAVVFIRLALMLAWPVVYRSKGPGC